MTKVKMKSLRFKTEYELDYVEDTANKTRIIILLEGTAIGELFMGEKNKTNRKAKTRWVVKHYDFSLQEVRYSIIEALDWIDQKQREVAP